ncbi:type A chloramphenicol O-acetyltransferase [Fictibacillus phosphorivorans]|uniref:type A chloramphenicol O-acetyltransferase n=1 Tax=Fictibacillus phosphorivorans TaxID=1221500 RepID=UPI0035F09AC3
MKFHAINKENWDRTPYFEHYLRQKCTFSLTAYINITRLLEQIRKKGITFYPTFLHMVSKVVNSHEEFRTCFKDGTLGYWEEMLPSYTIFHSDNKSFSSIWTEYSDHFHRFYKNYNGDIERYSSIKGLFTKQNEPPNSFPISMIPWVSFTGFNLNINEWNSYLLPIITSGKFFKQDSTMLLPLSLQVHHAVCDGYHASIFIEELQHLADDCYEWL